MCLPKSINGTEMSDPTAMPVLLATTIPSEACVRSAREMQSAM